MNFPLITTICVPPGAPHELEGLVAGCLAQTALACPQSRRIAAVDLCTPSIAEQLDRDGWEVIRAQHDWGLPPRMSRLLREAFAMVDTECCWTVEHDCAVDRASLRRVEALMDRYSDAGGIECLSVDGSSRGHVTRPCSAYALRQGHDADNLPLVPGGISFNCTLWRIALVRNVDWRVVPEWQKADSAFSAQMMLQGGRCYLAREARAIHYRGNCGAALRAWRSAAMGVDRQARGTH